MNGKNLKIVNVEPPEIMEGPHDIEISWGGTAIFTCKVNEDAQANIIWMKDDEELITNEKYKIMDNGTLVIEDTEEKDGGHYECVAKNPDGQAKSRPARMIVTRYNSVTQGYSVLFSLQVHKILIKLIFRLICSYNNIQPIHSYNISRKFRSGTSM